MRFTFVHATSHDFDSRSPFLKEDDFRTFDFLVQPTTNPPTIKTPLPAR